MVRGSRFAAASATARSTVGPSLGRVSAGATAVLSVLSVVALLAVAVVSATPADAQVTISRLRVGGAPVAPGGAIVVSADGCQGGSHTVLIGLLDADQESLLASTAVEPAVGGGWTATLRVPEAVRPGRYPVTARCVDHSGYGGYTGGGYDGTPGESCTTDASGVETCIALAGSYEYPSESVDVLPPPSPPAADGSLVVAPDVVAPGESTRVTGDGWAPGERITVVMYSSPVVLASVTAGATGAIDTSVRVPVDAPFGQHEVVAMNSTTALRAPVTRSASLSVVASAAGPGSTPTQPTAVPPATAPVHPAPTTPTKTVAAAPVRVRGTSRAAGLSFTGGEALLTAALGAALLALGSLFRHRARRAARLP